MLEFLFLGWKNQAEARLQRSMALEYKDIH